MILVNQFWKSEVGQNVLYRFLNTNTIWLLKKSHKISSNLWKKIIYLMMPLFDNDKRSKYGILHIWKEAFPKRSKIPMFSSIFSYAKIYKMKLFSSNFVCKFCWTHLKMSFFQIFTESRFFLLMPSFPFFWSPWFTFQCQNLFPIHDN